VNYLSISGLALDLTGVLLLGFDLVRIQRRLHSESKDRISSLDTILEEIGGIDGWADTVASDFREWQWEEGRTVMVPGTFDPERARVSFEEALGTISAVGTHVLTLAKMQLAAIDADRDTANLSLRFSYLGIALIIIGFCLQMPAYF
jgi:hypothetical protein